MALMHLELTGNENDFASSVNHGGQMGENTEGGQKAE